MLQKEPRRTGGEVAASDSPAVVHEIVRRMMQYSKIKILLETAKVEERITPCENLSCPCPHRCGRPSHHSQV